MNIITLRDYQLDLYQRICRLLRHNSEVMVSGPTGCGKTTITQAVVAMSKGTAYITHAVVAAPQTQIEDGFNPEASGRQIIIPAMSDDGVTVIPPVVIRRSKGGVFRGGWKKLRDSGSSGSNALDSYLKAPPLVDCVLTTHSTFSMWAKNFDYDLTGCVLFLDEGHHAGGLTELGTAVKKWLKHGGKIVYITATAFRSDRNNMFDKAVPVIRTMAEHAMDGLYAPRDFHMTSYNLSMEAQDIDEVRGQSCPKDTAGSVKEIITKWIADDRPKLILNVPSNGSVEWARELETAFLDAGARVFNAVGLEKNKQSDLMSILRNERAVKDYNESKVDVILSCQRFNEGTDWPLCSHVYNIGIPASLQLIIQRWGRAMRLKTSIANYPPKHLNVASLTFFPLRLSQDTWDKFSAYQKDQTFLMCAFLHNHEVAQEFAYMRFRLGDVGRKRSGKMKPGMKDLIDDVQNAIKSMMGVDMSAEAVSEGQQIIAKYTQATGIDNPTDVEVLDYAKKIGTDSDTLQVIQNWLVVRAIQGMSEETFLDVTDRISRKLLREKMPTPDPAYFMLIKDELRGIFDPVANMDKHSHLVQACAGTMEKVSVFTGRDAESVSKELASRLRVRVEFERAMGAYDKYLDANGAHSTIPTDSMDASEYCDLPANSVTFGDLKRAYTKGDV